MKYPVTILLPMLILFCNCHKEPLPPPATPPPLQLMKAYPVEGPGNFQPSGLTLYNNRLYTVSDKNDSTIFEIEISDSLAVCHPAVVFRAPAPGEPLDLEGISADSAGTFYLASESQARILAVGGGEARWHSASLLETGRAAGLFQKRNAIVEGLCLLPDGRFWLAAEREPRGLVIYAASAGSRAVLMDSSRYPFKKNRSFDFSGLFVFKDAVFALERNAFVVCRLEESADGIAEGEGRSFEGTENDPRFAYDDMRYGKAEGLALDARYIYVILDNNGDRRLTNPSDRRPLLFVFENPF